MTFDERLGEDQLRLNGHAAKGPALQRVSAMLDRMRQMGGAQAVYLVFLAAGKSG